ncbi:MAG: LPS export ABC transporter periplasmic protein LptC [Bacteroidia bacterium]
MLSCHESVPPPARPHELPAYEGRKIHYELIDSGGTRFRLEGLSLVQRRDSQKDWIELQGGVVAHIMGELPTTLEAERAFVYPTEGIAQARDNVRLRRADGILLHSEILTWDKKANLMYTPAAVKIYTPQETLQGMGLEASLDFQRYRIQKPQGKIQTPL